MTVREVPTRHGPARLHRVARAASGAATVVLGHGAGGGVESDDLQRIARAAAGIGCGVVLVEQPWRVAGRRIAPRPPVLDAAWADAVRALRIRGPLVLGGRSAGARVACRTAADLGATAVLAIAFPLHPPGRPAATRAGELAACPCRCLVVQGDRDAFGTAREVMAAVPSVQVVTVPGGDHGLARGELAPALEAVTGLLQGLRE